MGPTSEVVEQSESAIGEVSVPALLGFEDASLWSGPGSLTLSPDHTEGSSSLAIRPRNYSLYQSARFAFSGKPRRVLVDFKLPTTQPNPWWLGAVQLYLESRSKNVYNAFIGQVELTGRPLGVFNTLSFDVPEWVAQRIGPSTNDLQVKLAVNVPGSPGVYLLDDLRIQTELILHYRFDEAPGPVVSVRDSSGYDRHGFLRGTAVLNPDGRTGSALSLDGAGSFVEIPNGLLENVREMTFAAWINLAAIDPWARIFDFGGANGFAFLTASTPDSLLRYSAFAGFGVEGIATGPALPAGAWKHVALTTTGRDYRLFVDGIEAANTLTIPVAPRDIGANFENWIGRSRFPDPFLRGRIDDFRIYDRVLQQSEIRALAHPKSDYANWRFDDGASSTVDDASDLALDGTVFGSTTPVTGLIGGARRLDGTGGHVQLPAGVVQSCQDFTMSAWVNLRTNRPWNRVFDFGKPDFSSFMYMSPAGFGPFGQELRFGLIAPTGIHDVGFPFQIPLSEWTHLAVVLRGDLASLYLNGRAAVRQGGVTSNPSDMGATIGNYFGRSTFPADPTLDGSLDDFRMSCRAYTDNEIAQLAHVPAPATLPNQIPVQGDVLHVHDPVIIQAGGKFRIFSTGPGILTRTSDDMRTWTFTGSVFAQNPPWVAERIGNIDSLWAPDISFFGGTYHLYYSASTFGSNHSCIGHATKADLASPDPWQDHGPLICSNDGGSVDNFNAIDPNVVIDQSGTPWLSFGSFWGGIQLIRLDATGARADTNVLNIASRPSTAIEAPFIVFRAPYYYLFNSFDFCCQGANSNYRQTVVRSTSITGPYFDRTGLPALQGGGTPVLNGNARWRGPGHNALLKRGSEFLNVYHSYDALNAGIPTLRISELVWQEGWPLSAEP